METKKHNRWLVAIMCTILMIVLGTIYSWSFFQKLIVAEYGWSNTAVAWAFSASIAFIGFAAAWGGINLPKYGPQKLAMLGVGLHGIGYMLAALAFKMESIPILIIGFGLIGGIGLGLGYVTPVISAAKWFPDKKGLVTGMVVMGFGFGALLMSKIIAPVMMNIAGQSLISGFLFIGITIFVLGIISAYFVVFPPAGYVPEGFTPPVQKATQTDVPQITAGKAIRTNKFFFMWMLLFINVTAGIMFIGFQSPMMQDLWATFRPGTDAIALASIGATLIAISSLFNGIGRFFWGGMSDKIGRVQTFRWILGSQIIIFIILLFVGNPYLFAILVCYILLCYGGGFGTMPSFVGDVFTPRLMPVVYGTILTAWSAGGVVGPQIVAFMKDRFIDSPANAAFYSYIAGAILLAIGFIFALFLNNKPIVEEH
ncbi:MAG: OFA family MFS transporter [Bacteroidales bacterium]|nr:OFA family MFS transporter [Bacteroidales bacterium]